MCVTIKNYMKKLISLCLFFLACCVAFQSCSKSESYADMLNKERKAINKYIDENGIVEISLADFEKDTVTRCPPDYPDYNEYVQFSNGVYMQIVDRGDGDTIASRDVISVRYMEYDILEGDTTALSNFDSPYMLEVFDYTISGTTAYGKFRKGNILYNYNSAQVPSGWLVPLQYVNSNARVKLIVPSKMGHTIASQYVYPYFYDLRRIKIWE